MRDCDCCIVGGGPAGLVLGLLLARQHLRVTLLEAHETFERDFRGDGVHPSTQELLDQLGLLDEVRSLQHAAGRDFPVHLPDGSISPPVRTHVPSRFPETLQVRQAAFLDVLAQAAQRYPGFKIVMRARVEELIEEDGAVRGVRYRGPSGWANVRANLVVGADGRFSRVRQLARLPLVNEVQQGHVVWLRVPKSDADPPRAYGLYPGKEETLVIGDRASMWQIGVVFPDGGYQRVREAGLHDLLSRVGRLAPWVAERLASVQDWQQTSVLPMHVGNVRRWYRPGLLLIGDAAHVMSPVFGVGVNYAVQDSIVAANVLGPRLKGDGVRVRDLASVQRRRAWATRLMQFFQEVEEANELPIRATRTTRLAAPLVKLPPLQAVRLRLIHFGGMKPERARTADLVA